MLAARGHCLFCLGVGLLVLASELLAAAAVAKGIAMLQASPLAAPDPSLDDRGLAVFLLCTENGSTNY